MKDRTQYLQWRSASTIGLLSVILAVVPWIQTANSQEAPATEESEASAGSNEVDPWAGVEEMLVTGSGSASLLNDLAQANSVTSFDEDTLEAIGAGDISDLAAFTPNLEIVTAGSTNPTFFIRGIGLNDFNANAAGAVAIYQDNVALNSPAIQLGSLFDVGNVNVLRGPQGSRNFRNASAGSIRTTSRLPSGDFGANASIEYGNFNLVDIQSGLEFPVVQDVVSARVAFRLKRRGGFFRNRCAGAPDFSQRTRRLQPPPISSTDPSFSICGEEVEPFSEISDPVVLAALGLPIDVPIVFQDGVSDVEPFQRSRLQQENQFAARGILRFTPDLAADIETEWILALRGTRIDQPSTVGIPIGTGGTTAFPETGATSIQGLFAGENDQGFQDADITQERDLILNSILASDPTITQGTALAIANRAIGQQVARDLDPEPFIGAFSHTGTTRNETFGISLNGDTTFANGVGAKLVLGYDTWKRHVDVDLDFSPNTAFESETNDRGKQFYGDLSITKTLFEDLNSDWAGPIEWEVGTFALVEDLFVRVDINFGPLAGLAGPRTRAYTQTVESFGGYTHASWDFLEVFTLDGGFRFNWERRGIDYTLLISGDPIVTNNEFTNSEPTGTVRLTYNPTSDVSLYAKYTRGWKGGTFNATGNTSAAVTEANAETIDAFEVGTNVSLFDGRVNLLASFFHYAYQEYQLFTSQQAFQNPPSFVILNAEAVELFGSEVEVKIEPWEGGLLDFKFAWLEGEFIEFLQFQTSTLQDGASAIQVTRVIDNSGNRLLNAPEFTVNLTAQQSIPIGSVGFLTARWDGAWKDDTFFDASNGTGIPNIDNVVFFPDLALGQGAYWVHNVRLGFSTPDGGFEVAGWVRNVADEVYRTFAADLSTFQDTTLNFVGDPRTFGLSVALKF